MGYECSRVESLSISILIAISIAISIAIAIGWVHLVCRYLSLRPHPGTLGRFLDVSESLAR